MPREIPTWTLGFCEKPDRDSPGLKCGYPRPCPWHTVDIKDGIVALAPEMPADPDVVEKLIQIAKALDGYGS